MNLSSLEWLIDFQLLTFTVNMQISLSRTVLLTHTDANCVALLNFGGIIN